ncbi:MAG: hypothetical protein KAH38_10685, partial [Candidatus Hydrogenedentes bacterium]|nr:hypothetical protein [Candidatus Hydrogenedentota bacterium]
MVTATGICVLFAIIISGAPNDAPLPLQYWVVEGSQEERDTPSYDTAAQTIRDALQDLHFDTYRTLRHKTVRLQAEQDSRIPLK